MNNTEHPARTAIVLTAPAGWGKTRNAQKWRRELGARAVIDEWLPGGPLFANALHLTNTHPDQLVHLRCRVVVMGWSAELQRKHTRGPQ